MIVIGIAAAISSIAIANLLDSRISVNEASSIGTVGNPSSAQHANPVGAESGTFADRTTLENLRLSYDAESSGSKNGDGFMVTLGPADDSFTLDARPTN